MRNEIRWKQRFENFQNAFAVFERRDAEYRLHPDAEAYQMALVQAFEIVIELSWKTLKDYLELQGYSDLTTPSQTCRQAFQSGLIAEGETWLEALKIRNQTSHVYNPVVLKLVIEFSTKSFLPALRALEKTLRQLT